MSIEDLVVAVRYTADGPAELVSFNGHKVVSKY